MQERTSCLIAHSQYFDINLILYRESEFFLQFQHFALPFLYQFPYL